MLIRRFRRCRIFLSSTGVSVCSSARFGSCHCHFTDQINLHLILRKVCDAEIVQRRLQNGGVAGGARSLFLPFRISRVRATPRGRAFSSRIFGYGINRPRSADLDDLVLFGRFMRLADRRAIGLTRQQQHRQVTRSRRRKQSPTYLGAREVYP